MSDDNIELDGTCSEDEDCGKEDLPGIFDLGLSLFKDTSKLVRNALKGKKTLVPEEVVDERLSICDSCEYLLITKKNRSRCTKCGCFMDIKAHIATSECPIHKWNEWREDDSKNRSN